MLSKVQILLHENIWQENLFFCLEYPPFFVSSKAFDEGLYLLFFLGDYERHMEYEHDEEPSLIPPSPEPEDQVQKRKINV